MEILRIFKPVVVRGMEKVLEQGSPRQSRPNPCTDGASGKQGHAKLSPTDPGRAEKIANDIQQFLSSGNVRLQFQVHKATGHIVVKVVNEHSGRVIREIPEEQILDLAARIEEMAGGFFETTI